MPRPDHPPFGRFAFRPDHSPFSRDPKGSAYRVTARYIALFAITVIFSSSDPASADLLIVTRDRAIPASDIRLAPDGSAAATQTDGTTTNLAVDDILLLRFDPLPCHSQPRAWLCTRDGRQLSGQSLRIDPRQVTLTSAGGHETTVSRDELAALFFHAEQPTANPPPAGVRIISTNGDTLDAPAIELTDAGIVVDLDPDVDPIHLPRERVAGVIWPIHDAAVSAPNDPHRHLVELRSGERLIGRVRAIDPESLVLETDAATRSIPPGELRAVWFQQVTARPVTTQVSVSPPAGERPAFRLGRNALGSPLRIGQRMYSEGIGLRGPATVDVPVPANARWFLARIGADTDAAPFARVNLDVLVGGQSQVHHEDVAPGQPAHSIAVFVRGAGTISLRVQPAGQDPTGCLGDYADAVFIME